MAELKLSGVNWQVVRAAKHLVSVTSSLDGQGAGWVMGSNEARRLAFAILDAADQVDQKEEQR